MNRNTIFLGFAILISFSFTYKNENTSDWRGPNRQGIFYETGLMNSWPENGPELLWSYEGLGAGHSSPGIGNNCIFMTGMIDTVGVLYSFDMNGKLLWKKEYGEEWHVNYTGTRSTPLVVDKLVYLVSGMGEVFCFNANDGTKVWSVDMTKKFDGVNIVWGISESVLIDGDHLICTPGGKENNVVALDRFSGKTVWNSKGFGEPSAYCSPLLVEHNKTRLIITMTASSVIGINADNGELYWRLANPQQHSIHANTPVYDNGIIYCSSSESISGLLALKLSADGKNVEQLYRNEKFKNMLGGIVINNGTIYGAGDRAKKWFSVNPQTGEEKLISSDFGGGAIIFVEGLFYCYSQDGQVALVKMSPDTFEIISKFAVPLGTDQHWAHPLIHDKRMYIRHGNALMVYNISK